MAIDFSLSIHQRTSVIVGLFFPDFSFSFEYYDLWSEQVVSFSPLCFDIFRSGGRI